MLTLQNENLTLCVDPFGAQMMELGSKQGTQFLWNGDETILAVTARRCCSRMLRA